jgi:hypothetical protein
LTIDLNFKFGAHYHASRLSPYFRLALSIVAPQGYGDGHFP